MKQLAIKGHATRGKEVIKILEMLGGKNHFYYDGIYNKLIYTIGSALELDVLNINSTSVKNGYIVFTLEEFLEKFPYKVGDKVQHKDATSCGSVFEIEKMRWVNNDVEYIVKRLWYNNCHTTFTAKDLQPYKEETMGDKATLVGIDLTKELKVADEVEVILGDYEFVLKDGRTYFVKKKPKYPKTYVECAKLLGCFGAAHIDGYKGELLDKFQELLICRDAYWKLAGNWEYDVNKTEEYFYIVNKCGRIVKEHYMNFNHILAFPTEEMRDAFYENFKELIEQCKELL